MTEPATPSNAVPAPHRAGRYAIIVPACNEEECIRPVLAEIRRVLPGENVRIAVGVNGSRDRTASIARNAGAVVAETDQRGYGHGCQAAVDLVKRIWPEVDAYIFVAADGANDPSDIPALITEHERGIDVVLGRRTLCPTNWTAMGWDHVLANFALGAWTSILAGRSFADIGPLRLIRRETFERMKLQEFTYGWTIEGQLRAVQLGASVMEIPVHERRRIAGQQKVSRVSWHHSLKVGLQIFRAGYRCWRSSPRKTASGALQPGFDGAAGEACKS